MQFFKENVEIVKEMIDEMIKNKDKNTTSKWIELKEAKSFNIFKFLE